MAIQVQASDLAPSGGLFSVMTLHNTVRPLAPDLNAPVLPADRERASELFNQVVGTERETEFRSISTRHADKNASRSHYRAFLDEIEAMFTEPPAPTPEPQPMEEEQSEGVYQADDAELGSAAEEEVSTDETSSEETTDPDASDEAEGTEGGAVSDPAAVQAALLPITGGLSSQLASTLADGGQLTFTMMRVGDD